MGNEETLRDELIDLTCQLMHFASSADRPDQVTAVMDYAARYLGAIPGLFIHRSECEGKPAIVAALHDTRTPALMLNGHLDVIAAPPEMFVPQVRDNRIYGRGSYDMKGGTAVLLRLLNEFAHQTPRPDVAVQLVSDEEIGGEQGTGRLLSEGWNCGFFIAAEPTELRICYEQKGVAWLQLKLTGTAAHGSRPWEGHNPLLNLSSGLRALSQRFPPPQQEEWHTTVTPTRIETVDGANNQIPHTVVISFDIRFLPDEDINQIVADVLACFPGAELLKNKHARPLVTLPDAPVVQQLAEASTQVSGTPPTLYREHYGSDARFYSTRGIPSVCFGPSGGGMHAEEEWVEIDSLVTLYQTFRAYLLMIQA
jgi:succinyl-diaminopimelate desuccinylase